MYLIDTSIWVDYFREIENPGTMTFMNILDHQLPFGLTSVIYQEILQGAAREDDFNQIKAYFTTQRFFFPLNNVTTYESAATLYYLCRRKGITIRSTLDCLIAQIAIENNLTLLHNDQDYDRIKLVAPTLLLLRNAHEIKNEKLH